MQVSVEALEGLERKMSVSVPSERIEQEVDSRLKKLARTAKLNGFRPGKAPMHEITKRYSDSVRLDVARELVQSTLYEAIVSKELTPAGYPSVDELNCEPGSDLTYTALFEVYPEFEVQALDNEKIDVVKSEVTEAALEETINQLRKEHQDWVPVERKIADGDQVTINFEGFLDNVPFPGGKAEGFELVIGSKSMIPGFEDGLIGKSLNKEFELNITFPEDYNHEPLAGKATLFKITVTAIKEPKMADLNDAFAEKLGITEGGVEALKKDIRENMSRLLERKVSSMNREAIFNLLLEKNPITLPKALVEEEIKELKHEMYHRVFGTKHTENEKIPDFPRELFEEQAKRRVQLGLVFSEYVKKHEMKVDNDQIDAKIKMMSGAYEDPEALRQFYESNKQHMSQLEALILEEMVADKLLAGMKVKEKQMQYDDVMNPKSDEKPKGE